MYENFISVIMRGRSMNPTINQLIPVYILKP